MRIILKSLHLENFKGVADKTYQFGVNTRVSGMNRLGKTTIATAWYWLMADKNYELASNPNIRPDNLEECIPTVTAVLDVDGKEVTIAKMQKRKVSKPDSNGVSKVTLTNTYTVNEVPKSERDFKAYLEDLDFSFDNFLVCSHPDVFTGQKQADMRKVLFKMASEKSDYDIASMSSETADVAKLFADYKFEEIEAMNMASKKKATEQVGAIPNQIVGLEKAKVDVDVAELELQRNGLKEQISDYEAKISDGSAELDKMQDGIIELQMEVNSLYQQANDKLLMERREIQRRIDEADNAFNQAESQHKLALMDIERGKAAIKRNEQEKPQIRSLYNSETERTYPPYEELAAMDENSLICPSCGQELPEDERNRRIATYEERKEQHRKKYEEAKSKFKEDQKKRLADIVEQGKSVEAAIKADEENIAQIKRQIEQYKADKIRFNGEKNKAVEELSKLPAEPDMSENQEYERLSLELSTKQKAIDEMRSGVDYTAQYKTKLGELREELSSVEAEIAKSQNNIRIDEQISELQEKQRDYEQAKADAEKILYQLSLVSKRKNELLVEEINQHFGIVKWILFDYQKNGEYKEVCIPEIDGKRFGDSTNTGREIEAKLDICNSFQKFFDMYCPIFLDGAESINDKYVPAVDTQLILLSVTENKELKIEVA